MGVWGQRHSPAAFPPGKLQCPLYRRLGCRSWVVRKISSSPGFEPRTVQPVARSYTDYANPTHRIPVDSYDYYCYYCYYLSQFLFKIRGMRMQGIWKKKKCHSGATEYRWKSYLWKQNFNTCCANASWFFQISHSKHISRSRIGLHPLLIIDWIHDADCSEARRPLGC